MDAASHEEWPVERLASVSGVSEAHFARSFKDAFGVPPHRYLLTRRIERAKALLRDTDMTIIDIMMETGWQSLGTFGRVFRDITGESPTELRAREQASAHALAHSPAATHRDRRAVRGPTDEAMEASARRRPYDPPGDRPLLNRPLSGPAGSGRGETSPELGRGRSR
jgi:AraC-like DNA-binding protein